MNSSVHIMLIGVVKMRFFLNRWAWQDCSVFAIRIIWVISVIILMY
nr:hypothetical protein [Brevibacillus laterosporus]